VNSTPSPPPSTKSWSSPAAAITAAATDQKVCGDWETSNYSDVLVGTLRQIADSTIRGSFSAAPMQRPRLKIEVRVAKCFFKHFVSGAAATAAGSKQRNSSFSSDAAAAAGVARQALTSSYNWSSSFRNKFPAASLPIRPLPRRRPWTTLQGLRHTCGKRRVDLKNCLERRNRNERSSCTSATL
jgi:hypothetical protein